MQRKDTGSKRRGRGNTRLLAMRILLKSGLRCAADLADTVVTGTGFLLVAGAVAAGRALKRVSLFLSKVCRRIRMRYSLAKPLECAAAAAGLTALYCCATATKRGTTEAVGRPVAPTAFRRQRTDFILERRVEVEALWDRRGRVG